MIRQAWSFKRLILFVCDYLVCVYICDPSSSFFFFWHQLLENHIKNEVIENSRLVHALQNSEDSKLPSSEPRRSASVACGASVFEVSLKVPSWASQVLFSLLFSSLTFFLALLIIKTE